MTLKPNSKPPYPVLSALTRDDYDAKSSYRAEIVVRRQIGEAITIAAQHQLASPGIQELIAAGQAQYAVQVKCRDTRIRSLHQSEQPQQTVQLNDNEYAGRSTIQPLVIATADIADWQAADWTPRTKNMLPQGISIPPAALLAAGDRERFTTDDLETGDSIVQLAPTDAITTPGQADFDLDGEKVIIKVHPDTYREIRRMQANEHFAAALWPGLYQQAIQLAVRCHRQEDYRNRRWAANIRRRLDKTLDGYRPDDDEIASRDFYYAQLIMDNPLSKLLAMQTTSETDQ